MYAQRKGLLSCYNKLEKNFHFLRYSDIGYIQPVSDILEREQRNEFVGAEIEDCNLLHDAAAQLSVEDIQLHSDSEGTEA